MAYVTAGNAETKGEREPNVADGYCREIPYNATNNWPNKSVLSKIKIQKNYINLKKCLHKKWN